MKLILQIATGIVLGGGILLGATALIAEHLAVQLTHQLVQAMDQLTQQQHQQMAFYQAQLDYLDAQQARVSTEIQMARVELRERLLNRPPLAGEPPPPAVPPAQPSIAPGERQIIAQGGNAGGSNMTLSNTPSVGPDEARRKEEAWARFYTKPDDCGFIADQATMVRCGNDHIVKRREFEQLWEQGMIE